MKVRFNLKKKMSCHFDEDVIQFEQVAINYYQKLYPKVDVEKRLLLLANLFRWNPDSRVETKQELNEMIKKVLSLPKFTEDMVKAQCSDYATLEKMEFIWRLCNGSY